MEVLFYFIYLLLFSFFSKKTNRKVMNVAKNQQQHIQVCMHIDMLNTRKKYTKYR